MLLIYYYCSEWVNRRGKDSLVQKRSRKASIRHCLYFFKIIKSAMYYSLVKEVQEYETKILGMGTWVKDKLTSAAGKIV